MIIDIIAKFSCDRCGKEFTVEIDPASPCKNGMTVFEIAEDHICAGHSIGEDYCCSMCECKHLCGKCTEEMDENIESPVCK